MKGTILKICFLLLAVFLKANSIIIKQFKEFSLPIGQFSGYLDPTPDHPFLPAQYALYNSTGPIHSNAIVVGCGLRVRQDAKPSVIHVLDKKGHELVPSSEYFVDIAEKLFTIGSPQPGNWRPPVMCPKGYFADGFAARFGSDSRATLGFNGLHLRCRTITLSDTAFISDSYHNYPLSDFYSPEVGNFITAVRIKYLNSQLLTGIGMGFEPLPIISNIQLNYLPIVEPQIVPNVLDRQVVTNHGTQKIEKMISFSKVFETVNRWNVQNIYYSGYTISTSASGRLNPKKFSAEIDATTKISSRTEQRKSFGKEITTTYTAANDIKIIVPSCTQTIIQNYIKQQVKDVPFTAVLTFSSAMNPAQVIHKQTIKGIWQGTSVSNLHTKITQRKISCGNLR